jgi:hypothetical protein
MRARPPGLNGSESVFWEMETERGSLVLRAGWPDFLVERADGRIVGIEIKSGQDVLSQRQTAMLDLLERAGIVCFVWRPERDGLIPWREDVPPVVEPQSQPEPPKERPKIPFRALGVTLPGGEPRAFLDIDQFTSLVERTELDARTIQRWADGQPVRATIDRICREVAALTDITVAQP